MTPELAARIAARRARDAEIANREVWTCLRRRGQHGRVNGMQFPTKEQAEADQAYWANLGHWTKVVQGPGC